MVEDKGDENHETTNNMMNDGHDLSMKDLNADLASAFPEEDKKMSNTELKGMKSKMC